MVEMNLRNAQLSHTLAVARFVPVPAVQQIYSEALQKSVVTFSLISIIDFEASVDLSLSVTMIILDSDDSWVLDVCKPLQTSRKTGKTLTLETEL